MAETYDYSTGQIKRDFHFIAEGTICELRGLAFRTLVGSVGCARCVFHKDSVEPWMANLHCTDYDASCVICTHEQAKNTEGSEWAVQAFNEKLRTAALSCL